tara:strand:+ start:1193 stop:1465 length:273 start_codon:yes stop_codon:yes gene_type:complete
MKSKWHNIAIQTESFEELKEIQKEIPIRSSIPQVIEWLIRVGQRQINLTKSETGDSIKIKHLKNYIEEENKKKGEKNEQNNSKENNKKTV